MSSSPKIKSKKGTKSDRFEESSLFGKFLIAMPGMSDDRFERSVIYMCGHSDDGAMGFIINKPLADPDFPALLDQLNLLPDASTDGLSNQVARTEVCYGGPVEQGRGFVLHSPDYTSESTMAIDDDVSLTATLEILRAMAEDHGPELVMLALGYSSWAGGQLEGEIAGNGWLTCNALPEVIFDRNAATKYDRALASMGIDPVMLSAESGHA